MDDGELRNCVHADQTDAARIDAALVDEARRTGDTRAFGVLVRRHQGVVRAQLRRLLGQDHATADDLAQETFVQAWRKLHQFRGESRFATWLYRIAYACFLQHQRQYRPATPEHDPEHAKQLDTETITPELGLDLAASLQQLSAPQRAGLLYCVQLGLSHEEAAEVMQMPLGSVKTHILRGKAKLRQLLGDWSPNHHGEAINE